MNRESFEAKKFAVKFLKILFILIFLDFIAGKILEHYYFKIRSGLYHNITYIIDSTNVETLVFGSSRANHHYIPQVFENKLNTTFYNCGNDGIGLVYEAALIKAVTTRYTPKRILLDFLPNEFSFDESDRLSYLLPYRRNPSIHPYIIDKSQFETLKLFTSRIYPYNSLLTTIISGNIKPPTAYEIEARGYDPLNGNMNNSKPEKLSETGKILLQKIKIFEDLLNYLAQKNIACYVIISPDYDILDNYESLTRAKEICGRYSNVHFIDFSKDPSYVGKQSLFNDSYHLNNDGAMKFSADMCNRIQFFERGGNDTASSYIVR